MAYRERLRQEGYDLIPLNGENREAARELFAASRRGELAITGWDEAVMTAFLRQQFDSQERGYRSDYPNASLDLVQRGGLLIGRLDVDRQPDTIRVIAISLRPEFRNQGHGTALLRAILEDGAASRRVVTLAADPLNPAQRLYARLGFQPVAGDAVTCHWAWRDSPDAFRVG